MICGPTTPPHSQGWFCFSKGTNFANWECAVIRSAHLEDGKGRLEKFQSSGFWPFGVGGVSVPCEQTTASMIWARGGGRRGCWSGVPLVSLGLANLNRFRGRGVWRRSPRESHSGNKIVKPLSLCESETVAANRVAAINPPIDDTDPIRNSVSTPEATRTCKTQRKLSPEGKPIQNLSIDHTSSMRTPLWTPFLRAPFLRLQTAACMNLHFFLEVWVGLLSMRL